MLRSRTVQKRLLSTLLVLITLCLVSMGIRVPTVAGISSSAKPKPSPRAVIQNQIKTCKQIIKKLCDECTFVRFHSPAPPLLELCLFEPAGPHCLHVEIVRCIPSRAPPLLS